MQPSPFQNLAIKSNIAKAQPVFHNPNDPNSPYHKMKEAHGHLENEIGRVEKNRDSEGNLAAHELNQLKHLQERKLKLQDAMGDMEHAHDIHRSLNESEKAGSEVDPIVQKARESILKNIGGR